MSQSLNATPTKRKASVTSASSSDGDSLREQLHTLKSSLFSKELELGIMRTRLDQEAERADAAEIKAREAQLKLEELESHMAEVRRANEARTKPMPELELQLEQSWSWSGRRDLADARKRVLELEEELLATKSRAIEAERQQQLLQAQLARRQRDEETARELARELLQHNPTSYEQEEEDQYEEGDEGVSPRRVSSTQVPLASEGVEEGEEGEEGEEEVIHIDLTKTKQTVDDNQGDATGLSPELFAAMMMGAGLGRFSPPKAAEVKISIPFTRIEPSEEGEGEGEEDLIDDGIEMGSPLRLFGSSSGLDPPSPPNPNPYLTSNDDNDDDDAKIQSPIYGSSPPDSPSHPSDVSGRYSRGLNPLTPPVVSDDPLSQPSSGGLNSSMRGLRQSRQPILSMSALKEAALAEEQKERKERREAALASIGVPLSDKDKQGNSDIGHSSLGAFASATAVAAKAAAGSSSEGASDLNSSFGSIRHRRSAPMPSSLDDTSKAVEEEEGKQPMDLASLLGGDGDGVIIAPRYPTAAASSPIKFKGISSSMSLPPTEVDYPTEVELTSVNSGPFGNAKFAMLVEGGGNSDEAEEVEEEEGLESKTAAPSPSRLRNLRFDLMDLLGGARDDGDDDVGEEEEEEAEDVAVEGLKALVEELKEELLEQRAVNAGLRGDLRKLSGQSSGLKSKQQAKEVKPTKPPSPTPSPSKLQQHPSAPSGLEVDKRLTLYRDMLQEAFRSGTLSNEDLKDCRELLSAKGRESLDAGTEKVILIKLQKVLVSGADALRKIEMQEALREKNAGGGRGGVRGRGRRGGRRGGGGGGGGGRLVFSAGESVELPVSSLVWPAPKEDGGGGEGEGEVKGDEQQKEGPPLIVSSSPEVKKSQGHKPLPHKSPTGSGEGGDAGWKMERAMLLKRLTDLEKELEEATASSLKVKEEVKEEQEGGEGEGKGEGPRFTLSVFEERDERLDGLQKIIERSQSRAQELEAKQVHLSLAIEAAERKEAAAQEWILDLHEEVERLTSLFQISQAELLESKAELEAHKGKDQRDQSVAIDPGPSTSAAHFTSRVIDNDIYEDDAGGERDGNGDGKGGEELRAEVGRLKEELSKSQSWVNELQAELREQMMGAAKALGELATSLQKQNENQSLLDVLEERYSSSEAEAEALRSEVDSARSEADAQRAQAEALRDQLDAAEAESQVLREGLRGAVAEAAAARAEAGEAANEARELLAEGIRAAYGKSSLGVDSPGGLGAETSRPLSSLPTTPSSNRPILASSPIFDAAALALRSIPPPWALCDGRMSGGSPIGEEADKKVEEGESDGRRKESRLEEEKEELLLLVASLESHISQLESQVATLESQLDQKALAKNPEEKLKGDGLTREERERAEDLAAWRPDIDLELISSELESSRGEIEALRIRLDDSERDREVKAQEVKAARALAYDLSSEVDLLRSRDVEQQGRVETLLSEVDQYKADLGKVASELVQLMSDTVRLRSASATAYITSSSSTSPSRPLGGEVDSRPSYTSPARSVKGDDQSSDGSPLTASLWKRRLDHAKKEQEEMASELHSARKQVLELQRQSASERARISIEERRQRSKETEREVQQSEVQRRLSRLHSLVTATENKLRVRPSPHSPSSPLSHLPRASGGSSEVSPLSLEGLARELERRVGEVLVLALEAHGDLLIAKASNSSSSSSPIRALHQPSAYSATKYDGQSGSGVSKKAPTKQEIDDEPAESSVPISSWQPSRTLIKPATSPIDHLALKSQAASAAYEQAFMHAASAPGISPLSTTASKALSEAYASAQSASASKPSLLSSNKSKGSEQRALSPPTLRSSSYSTESIKSMTRELSLSQVDVLQSPRARSFTDIYSSPKPFIAKEL